MAMPAERYTSVAPIATEWEALADRTRVAPFLRPGWIDAWWRAFGSGTLDIRALRRDGELVAVLPLVRSRGGVFAPVNWHTPEFGATAVDDDAARQLYDEVLAQRPTFAFLRFVDDADTVPVEAARAAGFRVGVRTIQESPFLPLDGGWEALDHPRENEMLKRWRKLDQGGGLEFVVSRDTSALEEGIAIEGSGWKTEQGTAIASRPETRAFYTEVAHWAEERGILRLFFLRLGGRPVAFGLEDIGRYYFVKGGYDPEFRRSAPGFLIMREIVRWTCEQGLDFFEFLGAPDKVKTEWTKQVRRRVAVEAFAPTAFGRAAAFAYEQGRPLAKRGVAALRRAGSRGARDAA
jgi:CelD/BcsL family acetyltransferase involved in cellulose biosynthesis